MGEARDADWAQSDVQPDEYVTTAVAPADLPAGDAARDEGDDEAGAGSSREEDPVEPFALVDGFDYDSGPLSRRALA